MTLKKIGSVYLTEMSNNDSGSDLDDVPLSSLGVKMAAGRTEAHQETKKKNARVGASDPSPQSKKLKAETRTDANKNKKNSVDSVGEISKKSTPSKEKKEKPSPKKKGTVTTKTQLKEKKNQVAALKKKKKKLKKKSSSNDQTSSSNQSIATASAQLYSRCDKGKLIENVLLRWWYCYTWPDPAVIPSTIPSNCDALDGFPGVYVVTSGPNVGEIKDYRNHDKCPNFKIFSRKSSDELKTMLLEAVEKQRVALVNTEGPGTDTEEQLDKIKKWASKVNGPKADKEAEKILRCLAN